MQVSDLEYARKLTAVCLLKYKDIKLKKEYRVIDSSLEIFYS